jgi:glutamine amidotransferase
MNEAEKNGTEINEPEMKNSEMNQAEVKTPEGVTPVRIAIIDYGVGNIQNLINAFERLEIPAILTADPAIILNAELSILPGVGAYKDAMDKLVERGLDEIVKQRASHGKPMVGICLGMQLLFEGSEEDGDWEGLGLLKGKFIRFDDRLKVPHMGWNRLVAAREDQVADGLPEDAYAYFVHSYYLSGGNSEDIVLSSPYGISVPALVRHGSIVGMQFHPEKSGAVGELLIRQVLKVLMGGAQ